MLNRKYSNSFTLDAVCMALSSDKSQAQVARDFRFKTNESLYLDWQVLWRSSRSEPWHDSRARVSSTEKRSNTAAPRPRMSLFKYIEGYYYRKRRHSALGNASLFLYKEQAA